MRKTLRGDKIDIQDATPVVSPLMPKPEIAKAITPPIVGRPPGGGRTTRGMIQETTPEAQSILDVIKNAFPPPTP